MSSKYEDRKSRKRRDRYEDDRDSPKRKRYGRDSDGMESKSKALKSEIQAQMSDMKNRLARSKKSSSKSTFLPAPLLLDEQGRHVDADGKVITSKYGPVATLKANRPEKPKPKKVEKPKVNPYLMHQVREDPSSLLDPRIKVKRRETRGAKSFDFVKEGTYTKQGDELRSREERQELQGMIKGGYASGRNPNARRKDGISMIGSEAVYAAASTKIVGNREIPVQPRMIVPDMEWWDVDFLPKEKKSAFDKFGFIRSKIKKENPNFTASYEELELKNCGTANLIEHTPRIKSVIPGQDQPAVMPLMLTEAERKRLRRQNRTEREKEKQDKIALGLLPTPEPKVKLSNMMRVMQERAVADPSAVEKIVRDQVAQRLLNHEMRNQARKKTPEERRAINKTKLKQDASGLIHVAVFRVNNLSNPKNRFKVDVNAQQWQLTGGVLICKDEPVNLVVVEGGRKAIKGYIKLMTRRIDWNMKLEVDDEQETSMNVEDAAENSCALVWQGEVIRRSFNNFRFQDCRSALAARKIMESKNVVHYWDMVYNYEAPSETA